MGYPCCSVKLSCLQWTMFNASIGSSSCHKSTIKRVLNPSSQVTTPRHPKKSKNNIRSRTTSVMPRLVISSIFILLIFLAEISSGEVGSIEDRIQLVHLIGKIHSRKVLAEVTLDYDSGGPNPKDDPGRRGKGNSGGGGKNP